MTITPPSLLGIPTELKHAVVAYLPTSDILSLILTCRTLHTTHLPTLYRRISIDWSKDKSDLITTLLQSTSQNPTYYQYIKHLDLRVISDEKPTLRPSDLDVLKNKQPSIPQPSGPFPQFLTRLTHLTRLHISLPLVERLCGWYAADLCGDFYAPNLLSHFEHLTHFAITIEKAPFPNPYWCKTRRPRLPDARYFSHLLNAAMELPSLESVSVPWVGCLEFESGRRENPMGLRVLELVQTSVAPASLGDILLRAPRVERLVYDFWPGSEAHSISLSDLQVALAVLKPTLRELVLRINPSAGTPTSTPGSVQGHVGSLLPFANLTHLETSTAALYGNATPDTAAPLDTILPPSLRHLTLTNDLFHHPDCVPWSHDSFYSFMNAFVAQNDEAGENRLENFAMDIKIGVLRMRGRGLGRGSQGEWEGAFAVAMNTHIRSVMAEQLEKERKLDGSGVANGENVVER